MNETVRQFLVRCPVWEESVWTSIQQKNYELASERLSEFLSSFSNEDWLSVGWHGLLSGIALFRENTFGTEEWEKSVLPVIGKAVGETASADIINSILLSLDEADSQKLRSLIGRSTLNRHIDKITPIKVAERAQASPGGAVAESEPRPSAPATPEQQLPQMPNTEEQAPKPAPTPEPPETAKPTPPPPPAPEPETPAPETNGDLLYPAFKEGAKKQAEPAVPQPEKTADEPSPYLIHEESDVQPLASKGMAPLSRPQFFKSTAEEKPSPPPSRARLEIGAEELEQRGPIVGKTKKEVVRRVDYTAPPTQADPFQGPEAKKTKETPVQKEPEPEKAKADKASSPDAPKEVFREQKPEPPKEEKEVSPENIVNLKDLPK